MSAATAMDDGDWTAVQQFKQALHFINAGHKNHALELCAAMRLKSDPSLTGQTVRKIVNTLIVLLHDPRGFNVLSFAQIALRLAEDDQTDDEDDINTIKEELATRLMRRFQEEKLGREAKVVPDEKDETKQTGIHQGGNLNKDEKL